MTETWMKSANTIDDLADLLSRFLGRRGQDVRVNVQGSCDIGMAQTRLRHLHINALLQHDRSAKVSEVMEPTLRKVISLLQLGQQLADILRVNGLSVRMYDNKVCFRVLPSQPKLVFKTGHLVLMQLLEQHFRNIQSSQTRGRLRRFHNRLVIHYRSVAANANLAVLPVNVVPL